MFVGPTDFSINNKNLHLKTWLFKIKYILLFYCKFSAFFVIKFWRIQIEFYIVLFR